MGQTLSVTQGPVSGQDGLGVDQADHLPVLVDVHIRPVDGEPHVGYPLVVVRDSEGVDRVSRLVEVGTPGVHQVGVLPVVPTALQCDGEHRTRVVVGGHRVTRLEPDPDHPKPLV